MWHRWNGSVHQAFGSFINLLCGERDKGSGRAPLVNPRGPARKSVLRTALTSRVPDCGRLDSTYSPVPGLVPVSVRLCPPSMASRPCHSRFGSPISAGVNTIAVRWTPNEKQLLLEPRRPDKAKPPSGNVTADKMPDGASAYPAYGNGAGLYAAIRQSVPR